MSSRIGNADKRQAAGNLLDAFLLDTGVVGSATPRRYLWTDAFVVCTLLGLDTDGVETELEGVESYRHAALRLVEQVHHILGRHREDDPRDGWISGLGEDEGAKHPTAGGLRIGKPLPERGRDEPVDRTLEWERDGQYFHYLTKWMHALRRVGSVEQDATYTARAVELAKAAHRGFVHGSSQGERYLHWKMSIDLSRPQIAATGQHDPLDGYITYRTLESPMASGGMGAETGLQEEIADLGRMAGLDDGTGWRTDDPLGLGGLFTLAYRVGQLRAQGVAVAEGVLIGLLDASGRGLDVYRESGALDQPLARRLPFRELGLSIGFHALERLDSLLGVGGVPGLSPEVGERLGRLLESKEMARRIEETWAEPENREVDTWRDHEDINTAMLATSLAPRGYLDL